MILDPMDTNTERLLSFSRPRGVSARVATSLPPVSDKGPTPFLRGTSDDAPVLRNTRETERGPDCYRTHFQIRLFLTWFEYSVVSEVWGM